MPALTPLGAPEPMILMAVDPDRRGGLSVTELAEVVQAIYAEHYRLPTGHALPTAALESIAAGDD